MQRIVDLGADAAGGHALASALLLDLQVDLLAEDRDVPRSLDADADFLAHDRQDADFDVIADHDALVGLSCQYEHGTREFLRASDPLCHVPFPKANGAN